LLVYLPGFGKAPGPMVLQREIKGLIWPGLGHGAD
jgi:hypothetical protein